MLNVFSIALTAFITWILVFLRSVDCCLVKSYAAPIYGKALQGHVFKTLQLEKEQLCRINCYLEETCQSYNLASSPHLGRWECELSNTDDKQHPESLVSSPGKIYRATQNPCSTFPCVSNATCQPTFLKDESFVCICPPGFEGHSCQKTKIKKGFGSENPASTCAEVMKETSTAPSGSYFLTTEEGGVQQTYCHVDIITGCGEGPWTLVMKISGYQMTFHYNSHYWLDKQVYNPDGGLTGFDEIETKLPSYWSTPFNKMCLGMKSQGTTNWIRVEASDQPASLYSLIADGNHSPISVGRNTWKSLLVGSSLQSNCNMEGFNLNPRTYLSRWTAKARIGILGNNENHCTSCDSRLGFGTGGSFVGMDDSNSCGNEAVVNADNGNQHIKAHCYILVQ